MSGLKPEYEVAFQDILALVKKHADKMSPPELLAIASNMVGKLVAYQDQRKMTSAQAMEIVAKNIEIGNQQVQMVLANTGTATPN